MMRVTTLRRRPIMITFLAALCLSSLSACSRSATFSDELACGDLVWEDGVQGFVQSTCDTEHTAERFFYFESPVDNYDSGDISNASHNYCFERFLSRYDPDNTWDTGLEFVGVAPGIDEWNEGNHQILCIAFFSDGSAFSAD